ncbi:hypothetical protein M514_09358 [Trichuris suis]|uniref:Uncharacterized protein n=1 Tax=Trichuris suis TaxID=68888 RepID=A0A085NGB2_9BILA|nr:hypothetical protein M513_09358 [Trichuris suis]KFD68508.1 hypothetical protein M514_09358 [Trichuris suis]
MDLKRCGSPRVCYLIALKIDIGSRLELTAAVHAEVGRMEGLASIKTGAVSDALRADDGPRRRPKAPRLY